VLAIHKYLGENHRFEPVERLRCYLVDREQAWGDTWAHLDELMSTTVKMSTHFQKLDVTDPRSWEYADSFFDADLFTMSYFASEIFTLDQDGGITDFWNELFDRAKSGALFLYIDNGSVQFNQYSRELFERPDLEQVTSVVDRTVTPRGSEQASELEFYRKKFGRYSKLKTRLTYRVFRKR
jgi:hypothetical protein